eukprot:scaffold77616_cov55-Attheya_sp.AAC.2
MEEAEAEDAIIISFAEHEVVVVASEETGIGLGLGMDMGIESSDWLVAVPWLDDDDDTVVMAQMPCVYVENVRLQHLYDRRSAQMTSFHPPCRHHP